MSKLRKNHFIKVWYTVPRIIKSIYSPSFWVPQVLWHTIYFFLYLYRNFWFMRLYEVLKNNSGIKDSVPVKFSAGWILRLYNPLLFSFFLFVISWWHSENMIISINYFVNIDFQILKIFSCLIQSIKLARDFWWCSKNERKHISLYVVWNNML